MDMGISGLRVLVTAGAGGIGLKVTEAFLAEGARVHVCDVDAKALAELKRTHPKVTSSVCDVSDRTQVAALFKDAIAALGGLDCLINNAGIAGPTGPVHEINPEDWDRCVEDSLTSQINCARLAIPHMRKSANASIVNLSSAAGKLGFPLRSPFSAAKWGVIGFTKSLALELGPEGIRVNAILPGAVQTGRPGSLTQAQIDQMAQMCVLRRIGQPEDIAQAALFLASDMSSYITGTSLVVDGGLTSIIQLPPDL